MAEISLVAEVREEHGSASARRLRTAGRVPGVLYGHGLEPVALSVDARALRAGLSSEAGANTLFELEVAGKRHLAMPRQLQRHPVRHTVAHIDFQVVNRDEVIAAEVPLVLVGEATAVQRAGGTIEHLLVSLSVKAKPGEIPSAVEIDVSDLEVGDSVRVGDLSVPSGISVELDEDTLVVVAHAAKVQAAAEEGGEEGGEEAGGQDATEAASSDEA